MSLKNVFAALAVVLMAAIIVEGVIDPTSEVSGDKDGHDVYEILFPSNDDGVGKNGSIDADNATIGGGPNKATASESSIDNGSGSAPSTSKSSGGEIEHPPIRFGQWTILGCHNNEETWGCELRRLLHASTVGFIDTLRFTVRKDKSLKMIGAKEPCSSNCDSGRKSNFRIVIQCPKNENGCSDEMLRRFKVVYFQAGFLCAVIFILASILVCACLCKAADSKKRGTPEKASSIKLVSKNAMPAKW